MNWAARHTLVGLRHYWGAFAYWSEVRAPMKNDAFAWRSDSGISIPWAVMDDFGDLVAVPGPNQ